MSLSETWIAELRGAIHGRIQTLRGMCTDERPHVEIDAKLTELDELVYNAERSDRRDGQCLTWAGARGYAIEARS